MNKWIMAVMLVIGANFISIANARSETNNIILINIPHFGKVPYQRLFEMISNQGESEDSFAMAVASRLRAFTNATEFEACGVIAHDSVGHFGVVIGTNEGHAACANFSDKIPNGMIASDDTIHSHLTALTYRANRTDRIFLGLLVTKGEIISPDKADLFSDEDFQEPGYLVGGDRLWHQKGKATVRLVGNFTPQG